MSYFSNLKEHTKDLSTPALIAGLVIPGGLTLLALYLAYKARKPKVTMREFVDKMIAEEKANDRTTK